MITGILHLSDFHFRSNDLQMANTLNIENVIRHYETPIDSLIILITGDIGSSCKSAEYKCAKSFIAKLQSVFRAKGITDIHLFFVPGNHDIALNIKGRGDKEIQKYYAKGTIIEELNNEFEMQKNFFDFSNKYGLFTKEKLVEIKDVNIGNNIARFVLINSSPFSTLTKNGIHTDKNYHYCRNNIINQINHDGVDYIFTVIHHPFEWFEDESRYQLEDLIKNRSEVVFMGHDHCDSVAQEERDNNDTIFSRCGEINFEQCIGEFNFIVYDDIDAKFIMDKYKIESGKSLVKVGNQVSTHLNTKKNLNICKNFLGSFYTESNLKNDEFLDTFVFPKITKADNGDVINDVEELISSFSNKKISFIKGLEDCGKTSLLKVLHKQYLKNMYPVYLNIAEIGNTNKSAASIIRGCIKSQYSVDAIDKFIQEDIEKKVLLIDNIDSLGKDTDRNGFFKYLLSQFNIIVVTTSAQEWNNIRESFKDSVTNEFEVYNMAPFAYGKRNELVERLCSFYNCADEDKIEGIKNSIDKIYKDKVLIIGGSTAFLARYIKRLIDDDSYSEDDYVSVYNGLYENDIVDLLRGHVEQKNVLKYMTILSDIAFEMHRSKHSNISEDGIYKIINDHNSYFGSNIRTNNFINVMLLTKILEECDGGYSFTTRLHLAFFVAKKIVKEIQEGKKDDFIYCLNNICFGINDDIVLFVLYFIKTKQLVNDIYNEIVEFFENKTELDFDDININYLRSSYQTSKKLKISERDYKEYEKSKDKSEQEKLDNLQIKCEGIYDYDEKEVNNIEYQIPMSIKLTEMLSKIIAITHNDLSFEQRKEMLTTLSSSTYKTLYLIFKDEDEDLDEFINEIVELESKEGKINKEERIKYYKSKFIDLTMLLVHELLSHFSNPIADENSRGLMESLNDCTNDKLFVLHILTNIYNTDRFVDYMDNNLVDINYLVNDLSISAINAFAYKNRISNKERDKLVSFASSNFGVSSDNFKSKLLSMNK